MGTQYKTKKEQRTRRHLRLRQTLSGTATRPRLCVNFSNQHMYAQVIDDERGMTLAAVSSQDKEFRSANGRANMDGVSQLGKVLGEKLKSAGISECVFDRGGFRYHGRVKALADAVREVGLKF